MGVVSEKLRKSARGEACTLQIPGVCNCDWSTTVLAHLPSEVAGRSTKSDDWHSCYACMACHSHFDLHRMSKADETWYAYRGLQRTLRRMFETGLLVIAGTAEKKPKPLTKIFPRDPDRFHR